MTLGRSVDSYGLSFTGSAQKRLTRPRESAAHVLREALGAIEALAEPALVGVVNQHQAVTLAILVFHLPHAVPTVRHDGEAVAAVQGEFQRLNIDECAVVFLLVKGRAEMKLRSITREVILCGDRFAKRVAMDRNFVAAEVTQQHSRGVQFQIAGWSLKSPLQRDGETLFVSSFEFRRVESRRDGAPDFSLRLRKFSQMCGAQLQFAARAAAIWELRIAVAEFAVVARLWQVRGDLRVITERKHRVEPYMIKWLAGERGRAHRFDQVIENFPG